MRTQFCLILLIFSIVAFACSFAVAQEWVYVSAVSSMIALCACLPEE